MQNIRADMWRRKNQMNGQLTICVLGASETVLPWGRSWVNHLQGAFASEGIAVNVFATGSSGITYQTALTQIDPLIGMSYAQLTSDKNPDVIIIELGVIDAIVSPDGRTQAEIIADAQALYDYFRSNNPNAYIIYSRLTPYDEEQHAGLPVENIKKKYCSPWMHETSTIPGDTGLFTSEEAELGKIISSTMQSRLISWKALDSECQSLADISISTSFFRPSRLGLTTRDRTHLNSLGHYFVLSKIWLEFQMNSEIRTAIPILENIRNIGEFVNFDQLWSSLVKPDSAQDGYEIDPDFLDGPEYPVWEGLFGHNDIIINFAHWGNVRRPEIGYTEVINQAVGEYFTIWISNLWPNQEVKTKLWQSIGSEPTTWSSFPEPRFTSSTGGYINITQNTSDFPAGLWYLKINVGKDVFGPLTIKVV
jgi:lysophospholipase L1-like esterase